jgi:hypothetical protein
MENPHLANRAKAALPKHRSLDEVVINAWARGHDGGNDHQKYGGLNGKSSINGHFLTG